MHRVVISIGAGISQLPYLEEIIARGYQLLSVDQDPDAPGFVLSDYCVVASTYDAEKVTNMVSAEVNRHKLLVVGVVSACTGPPYRTLQKIRKHFSIPYTKDKVVDCLLDKRLLRGWFNKNGFSKIPQFCSDKEINESSFPIIKKPRFSGMGGKGIKVYKNYQKFALDQEHEILDENFVYELMLEGKEIAVDALWNGSDIVFLSIGFAIFNDEGNLVGATCGENSSLSKYRVALLEKLKSLCELFQLSSEMINADVIITNDGVLHFIEVEFVPADIVWLAKVCFDYDIVKNFISIHLGEKPDASLAQFRHAAIFANMLNLPQGHKGYEVIPVNPFYVGKHSVSSMIVMAAEFEDKSYNFLSSDIVKSLLMKEGNV